jgi:surface-anchored protein
MPSSLLVNRRYVEPHDEQLLEQKDMKSANRSSVGAVALLVSLFVARAEGAGLYTHGHGDVRAYFADDELRLRYQLDYSAIVDGNEVGAFETGAVSFALDELTTVIPDVPVQVPDLNELPSYGFVGAETGAPLWLIPEVQEFDRPWLGFSTEELSGLDWVAGTVQIELLSVAGPSGAYFSLFQSDPVGQPIIQFATSDGINADDVYALGTDTHAHMNWVFTEPGLYDVTLKFSGEHRVEGYQAAVGTVRFAVAVAVPEPGAGSLAAMAATFAFLLSKRRRFWSRSRATHC